MFQLVNFCLFVILQVLVVSAEPIPMHCWVPPPEVTGPEKCCKLPEMFKEEDFKVCDVDISAYEGIFRPWDCSQHICLLKRYNAITNENRIDKNATLHLMDAIVETYSDFEEAVEEAKKNCVGSDSSELLYPDGVCEPIAVISCITAILIMDCPKWEESANCDIMKNHFEECRNFIFE